MELVIDMKKIQIWEKEFKDSLNFYKNQYNEDINFDVVECNLTDILLTYIGGGKIKIQCRQGEVRIIQI